MTTDRPTIAETLALIRRIREVNRLGPDCPPELRAEVLEEKRALLSRLRAADELDPS